MSEEEVDHPAHYGGEDDPFEVMKVLEAWDLELAKGFCWGNLIKYTARAGKKGSEVGDRLKAEWYANRLATITATLEGRKMTAESNADKVASGGRLSWQLGGGSSSTRPDNCEMPNLSPRRDWLHTDNEWDSTRSARPLGKRHDGTDEQ